MSRVGGLHPCDHSTAKVNISEKVLYTTAERAKGDTTCEADHPGISRLWISASDE